MLRWISVFVHVSQVLSNPVTYVNRSELHVECIYIYIFNYFIYEAHVAKKCLVNKFKMLFGILIKHSEHLIVDKLYS